MDGRTDSQLDRQTDDRTNSPICLDYKVNRGETVGNMIIKVGWNQIVIDLEGQNTLLRDELTS